MTRFSGTRFTARPIALCSAMMLGRAFAQAPPAPAPQGQTPPVQTAPAQTAPAQTAPAQPAPAGNPVGGFNLNNASLIEVIDTLARELKINYVLDATVKGGSVTVNTFGTVRDVDLRPLFETILRMNNL